MQVRNHILGAVFGPDGMTHAESTVQYEVHAEVVEGIIQESAPAFMNYFMNKMKPFLDENHNCVMVRSDVHSDGQITTQSP